MSITLNYTIFFHELLMTNMTNCFVFCTCGQCWFHCLTWLVLTTKQKRSGGWEIYVWLELAFVFCSFYSGVHTQKANKRWNKKVLILDVFFVEISTWFWDKTTKQTATVLTSSTVILILIGREIRKRRQPVNAGDRHATWPSFVGDIAPQRRTSFLHHIGILSISAWNML